MRLASFVPLALAGTVLLIGCGGDSTNTITAKSISIINGNAQSGPGGDDLPDSLRVSVLGSDGGALVGATITWAVTTGGATVSPLTTTTGANGEAAAFVSLGPAGPVTITATVHGLAPATFTATASNPCAYLHTFGVAQTAVGKLRQYDCAPFGDGSFVDFYWLPLSGQQALSITMTAGFDTYLILFDLAGNFVGSNNDQNATTTNSRLKVLAAGGDYVVGANSFLGGETGPYTLNAVTTTASEDNCEETWSTLGVSTNQVLSSSDCTVAGFYSDTFLVVMFPGDSLDATVTGATFDSELQLHNGASTLIASDDSVGGTHLAYTVTAPDVYPLVVTSMTAGAHGAYTLTLAAIPVAQAALRTPRPLTLPRGLKGSIRRSLRAK